MATTFYEKRVVLPLAVRSTSLTITAPKKRLTCMLYAYSTLNSIHPALHLLRPYVAGS